MNRRSLSRWVLTGGILVASVAGIGLLQSKLARAYETLGKASSLYAIPQPEHLVVFSLGYRSALAELIFGRTLVDVGVHFVEKRVFEHLDAYLWAIIGLDPTILDLYKYADTMLTLSTVEMPMENFRQARDIVEYGLKQFPGDGELWLSSGMFVALMAPPRLTSSKVEDVNEWKAAGAQMIEHGCALLPTNSTIPPVCLTGARISARAGQTEAAIRSMERLLAMTEDEDTRARAMTILTQLQGEQLARESEQKARRMEDRRLNDLPELNRVKYQLVVPQTRVKQCVGLAEPWERVECISSYAELDTLRVGSD